MTTAFDLNAKQLRAISLRSSLLVRSFSQTRPVNETKIEPLEFSTATTLCEKNGILQ